MVSSLGQPTQYTIHGSDFQRANTPPSLGTEDFVSHVPLDRWKSMPARSLVILETSASVSQLRRLAHLASWKGIWFWDFFFQHPKVSNLSCTGSNQPPWGTAWPGTQHKTHFWSHHVTSNMSSALSRKTANKQISPKQVIWWSSAKRTSPRGKTNKQEFQKAEFAVYPPFTGISPKRAAPRAFVHKHTKHKQHWLQLDQKQHCYWCSSSKL